MRRSREVDAEHWPAIEMAFSALRDHAPEQQEAALITLFPLRPELSGRVRRLLAAERMRPEGFLEASGPAELLGEHREIGGWRLVRRIGEGGHGEVFLVTRSDDPSMPLGALKLLKGTLGTSSLDHLKREREMLGQLGDTRCARYLDAGVSADGQPYLVTEHVEGLTLDAWIDQRRPTLATFLLLAIDLCDALASLHRRLVIHLDLKPTNIMVGLDGRVRLLDLGIASLAPRDERARAMTPAYASPEQLAGEAVTTQSDIFSLGVLLFEALADERPDPRTASPLASGTLASHGRPSPIRGATATRLRGDLDAILACCLRPLARERYSSIEMLADDLERFLAVQPVRARRGARLYGATKALERHWVGWSLAATGTVMMLVLGGVMGRQQALVERERVRQGAALEVLGRTLSGLEPGHSLDARLLDDAGTVIESLTSSDPPVRARALAMLGTVQQAFRRRSAGASLERTWRLLAETVGPDHDETLRALESFARQAVADREDRRGPWLIHLLVAERDRQRPRRWAPWARAKLLSAALLSGEQPSRAEAAYRAIIANQSHLDDEPELWAAARAELTELLLSLERIDEAIVVLRPGLDLELPPASRAELARARLFLAQAALASRLRDSVGAVVAIQQAVDLRSRWLGPNHPATLEVLLAGVAIANRLEDEDHAERWSRDAYQRSLQLPDEHPQRRAAALARVALFRRHGHHNLARLTLSDLRPDSAELADPLAAWQLYELGRSKLEEGAHELARRDFERAKLILLAHPDPDLISSVERALASAVAGAAETQPAR